GRGEETLPAASSNCPAGKLGSSDFGACPSFGYNGDPIPYARRGTLQAQPTRGRCSMTVAAGTVGARQHADHPHAGRGEGLGHHPRPPLHPCDAEGNRGAEAWSRAIRRRPSALIAASHVVAVEFATIAAANNYWRR